MHKLEINGFYRVSSKGIPGVEENTKDEVCEVLDFIELLDDDLEFNGKPGYNVLMLSGPDEGMEFYVAEDELVGLEPSVAYRA